jgi:lipopolysaccharide export system permease protein
MGTTLIIALDPFQKALDYSLKQNVDAGIVFTWFVNSLPKDMLFIFPTSSLLAGLLVFSTLSRNSEIVAIQAGGIGLFSMLIPVTFFSVGVFLLVLLVQDRIIPPALTKRSEIFRQHIRKEEEPKYRKDVVMRISGERLLCIGKIDLENKQMKNLLVLEYDDAQRVITAGSAVWKEEGLWLLQDVSVSEKEGFGTYGRVNAVPDSGQEFVYELGLDEADLLRYDLKDPSELSYSQILSQIRYHEERAVISTVPLWVDLYSKSAFPFAAVIFAFLGSTMGISSPRRGGFMGFGVSLVMSFIYFVIMGFSVPLGKNGVLNPLVAGWMQNFVFIGMTFLVVLIGRRT